MARGFSLAKLVAPLSVEEFRARHWQKAFLVQHGPLARLHEVAELPVLQDANALLARYGGKLSGWRGHRIPSSRFFAAAEAETALAAGYSLYLLELEKHLPELLPLVQSLARDLGIDPKDLSVEGFLSTVGAGLMPHLDLDDNFNIQIVGKKRWRLSDVGRVPHPHLTYIACKPPAPSMQRYAPGAWPRDLDPATETIEAGPGSVVFIPSGTWHATECLTPSIAIAFSCKPKRWAQMLFELLAEDLQDEAALRARAYGQWPGAAMFRREDLDAALDALRRVAGRVSPDTLLPRLIGPGKGPSIVYERAADSRASFSRRRDATGEFGVLSLSASGHAGAQTDIEIAAVLCDVVGEILGEPGPLSAAVLRRGEVPLHAIDELLAELAGYGLLRPR